MVRLREGARREPWFRSAPLGALTLAAIAWTALGPGARPALGQTPVWLTAESDDPSCPSEEWLRAEVANRLGRASLGSGELSSVVVRIETARERAAARPPRSAWRTARFTLLAPSGEALGTRELTSREPDCRALASAVALAIAVALDELASLESDAAQTGTPPAAAPLLEAASVARQLDTAPQLGTAPAPGASSAGDAASPATSRIALRASLGGGVSFGPHPDVAALAAASLGLRVESFSAELELRAASETGVGDASGAATLTSLSVGLLPCGHLAWFALCGAAGLGYVYARGFGLDLPTTAEAWVPTLGVAVRLEWPLTDVLIARLKTEVDIPFVRPSVVVDGAVAWSAPPVQISALASLVAEVR